MAKFGIKGLYRKQESGWFYYQPPTPEGGGGRPRAVALGTQDLVKAIEKVREMAGESRILAAARKGTLEEVLPIYYREKGEDEKSTRLQREVVLNGFRAIVGNIRVGELTAETVRDWRDHLREFGGGKEKKAKGLSPSSLKSYTIVLKAFVKWAGEAGYLKGDPMKKVGRRQVAVKSTRVQDFLTVDERELLLAGVAEEETSEEAEFIVWFGFFTGLRDGEMLAMTRKWLWISDDWSRGTLTVQDTEITFNDAARARGMWSAKGKRKRVIPLAPRLLEWLRGYGLREPFMLAPQKPLWPAEDKNSKRYDAKKALAGLARRVGVRKLNYHILRHSFGTHLAMKGVPMVEIAALLGDTVSVTEEHYVGFSPSRVSPVGLL
jgi:integrase